MTMRRITQHKSSEDKMKRRCDNVVLWSITNIRLFFKEISQDRSRNHGCNFRLDLFLYVTKLSKNRPPRKTAIHKSTWVDIIIFELAKVTKSIYLSFSEVTELFITREKSETSTLNNTVARSFKSFCLFPT